MNAHKIGPVLEEYNVKFVLSGHIHMREIWLYKGMNFTCTGALSGNWWKGSYKGHPEGFSVIKIRGEEFDWDYRTFGWDADVTE